MASLAERAVVWQDDKLILLDQRKLPHQIQFIECTSVQQVIAAIRHMVVRGAPAIGVTAAYGVVLAARTCFTRAPDGWKACIQAHLQALRHARPTAVNLSWAISRMREVITTTNENGDPEAILLSAARAIHRTEVRANKALGEHGAELISNNSIVLTHCNAGALATAGHGTALGVIRSAYRQNKITGVYANETRPWFQGSRLTAWELLQDNVPVTLICDSAAASLMRRQKLAWVIVGADRIASNGDVANKIGTYSLAVMAHQHNVNFMVAAATSSIDMEIENGDEIEIEERPHNEITHYQQRSFAPEDARVWNPVFDVTPAPLVTALVTEKGVIGKPTRSRIKALMRS